MRCLHELGVVVCGAWCVVRGLLSVCVCVCVGCVFAWECVSVV